MRYLKITVILALIFSDVYLEAQSSSTVATSGYGKKYPGRKAMLILPPGVKGIIHGRVNTTKENQIYLAGVKVRLKGTKISAVTDNNGSYSLDITTLIDSKERITVVCELKNYSTIDTVINKPFLRETILMFQMIPKKK